MPNTQWGLRELTDEFLPIQQLSSVCQTAPISRKKRNKRKFKKILPIFFSQPFTCQIKNKKQMLHKNSEHYSHLF